MQFLTKLSTFFSVAVLLSLTIACEDADLQPDDQVAESTGTIEFLDDEPYDPSSVNARNETLAHWGNTYTDYSISGLPDGGRRLTGYGQWFGCRGNGGANNYTQYDMSAQIRGDVGRVQIRVSPNKYVENDCDFKRRVRTFKGTLWVWKKVGNGWKTMKRIDKTWENDEFPQDGRDFYYDYSRFGGNGEYRVRFNTTVWSVTKSLNIRFKYVKTF